VHADGLEGVNVKGHRSTGVEAANSGDRWSSEKGSEADGDGFGEGHVASEWGGVAGMISSIVICRE